MFEHTHSLNLRMGVRIVFFHNFLKKKFIRKLNARVYCSFVCILLLSRTFVFLSIYQQLATIARHFWFFSFFFFFFDMQKNIKQNDV